MSTNTKRIGKEIVNFQKAQHNNLFLCEINDDLMDLRGLLFGPEDTPFEGGFFYFSIIPEDYPNSPPKVKFLTPYSSTCRIHPNLYACGKVCLSILGTWGQKEWSPLLTFEKILLTIQGLLDNNPLSHEPSFETIKGQKAEEYTVQSRWLVLNSVIKMLERKDLPDMFMFKIREYFVNNFGKYMKSLEILGKYHNKSIQTIHGTHKIDVEVLRKLFEELYKKLA